MSRDNIRGPGSVSGRVRPSTTGAFFFVANYTLSFLSVFALRRKEPETPRPWRVPGFPFTTGLALLGSLAFLAGSVVSDWSNSWNSLLLLALSYPVYRTVVARRSA